MHKDEHEIALKSLKSTNSGQWLTFLSLMTKFAETSEYGSSRMILLFLQVHEWRHRQFDADKIDIKYSTDEILLVS